MATAPFGIEIHSSIDNLNIIEELADNKFHIIPSTPHHLFSTYVVQATKSHGVVWIKAVSDIVSNDGFGGGLRDLVDQVAKQITSRYGEGKKSDFILHGAMWNSPQYWMAALEANERIYNYAWGGSKKSNLPEDIRSIIVAAGCVSQFEGLAIIEYESSKMKDAKNESDHELSNLF